MFVAAALRAVVAGMRPAGDLVLAFLSDEEAGGDLGAAHLVRERPDLLAGVRYALGEFGGFTLELGGRRFYPIRVAEKQLCWLIGLCYSRRGKRTSWRRSTGWWQVRQWPSQQRRRGCRSSTACGSVRPAAALLGTSVRV
jgi:hypothetical protein